MRSIQSRHSFPLSSVKPLEEQHNYRGYCLQATRRALHGGSRQRKISPLTGTKLRPYGEVEGFMYLQCEETGSLFLAELPADPHRWGELLSEVNRYRRSPEAFQLGLAQSRTDNVYTPKLEWIQETLRLQEMIRPQILEAMIPPSSFTPLLKESGSFSEVLTIGDMELAAVPQGESQPLVQTAVLLESLDRVDDPGAVLNGVAARLAQGGLLFITALVASGFDLAVLGARNLYLYPPDRANCFSLKGLMMLLKAAGFTLLEVSTPGVLDVEIVRAHVQQNPGVALSAFERQLIEADRETHTAFQAFLQQRGLSSFARVVARKSS